MTNLMDKLRQTRKGPSTSSSTKTTRNIEIGWLQWDPKQERFVSVRLKQGGGTRTVSVPKEANREDVIKISRKYFSLEEKSDDLVFGLAKFNHEVIKNDFNIGKYAQENGLTRIRLYLTTIPLEKFSCKIDEDDKDNEGDKQYKQAPVACSLDKNTTICPECSCTKPIDSECIICQQNKEYHKSLEKDQSKNVNKTETRHEESSDNPTNQSELRDRRLTYLLQQVENKPVEAKPHLDDCAYNLCVYAEYINLLSDNSDEEEDPSPAGIFSPTALNSSTPADIPESTDLATTLKTYQEHTIDKSEVCSIVIHRRKLIASTLRAIKKPGFHFRNSLKVNFAAEAAIDEGGPTREFFTLLMKELPSMGIFQGEEGKLTFSHNIPFINEFKYLIAGQLVAWSLLHGGPGPNCMANIAYYSCFSGKPFCHVSDVASAVSAIPDVDLKDAMSKMTKCSDENEFLQIIDDHGSHIADHGFPAIYASKLQDRKQIIQNVLMECMSYKVKTEIQQFVDGLNSINDLGNIVAKNIDSFQSLFCATKQDLTAQDFKRMCNYCRSLIGSNKSLLEEDTIYSFEIFLETCEEGNKCTLADLLQFITGADKVPPMGFPKQIEVVFFENSQTEKRRPYVSTCDLKLYLPVGYDVPELFEELFIEAIFCSKGFGLV